MVIFIDPDLPHYSYLYNKLQGIYTIASIDNKDTAEVYLRYAHDKQFNLTPFEQFNMDVANGVLQRTIFFTWYNWRKHRKILSAYFHPQKTNDSQAVTALWNPSLCRHHQLPCTSVVVIDSINQLKTVSKK